MTLCDRKLTKAVPNLQSRDHTYLASSTERSIPANSDHYHTLQTTLCQHLENLQTLNPHLYQQELIHLELDQLLEQTLQGDEQTVQTKLSTCIAAINQFYEDYKLLRLARTVAKVREARWNLKRATIACRVFPLIGLVVAGFFLQLALEQVEAIALTVFVVAPLLLWITHSMRSQIKHQAQQELERRRGILLDEWCRLTKEEKQVLDVFSRLKNCLVQAETTQLKPL